MVKLSRFNSCKIFAIFGSLFLLGNIAFAASFERKDVTFVSEGLKCAAWYYTPTGVKADEKRPAIVMAHGWSAVKEMYLDKFAEKFAEAGFVVTVFDYRRFGGSEGEPRAEIIWRDQITDYKNAISWTVMQKEVDGNRIGVWGSSYSGGHVMQLAAFDKRVKAVVSQVPVSSVWNSYYAGMNAEAAAGTFGWLAQDRAERYATGKVNYIPVTKPEKERGPGDFPAEWHDFFDNMAKARAPSWLNKTSVRSIEDSLDYDPTQHIHLIAPTPLLMIVAENDVITPTELEKQAFTRAKEPKKLVVVPGGHFEAYDGPKFPAFVNPATEWFKQHLMK